MRFIGIALIIVGLFYSFGKPFFSSQPTGAQVARTVVYDRSKSAGENAGWQVSSVFLEKENSPLKVQIKMALDERRRNTLEPLKLLIRLAPVAQNGNTLPAILNQPVTIDADGDQTAFTDEFEIKRTGQFKFGAFPIAADNVTVGTPDLEIDDTILSIEAMVLATAEAGGTSGWLMGIGFVVLGIIMLSIFRRKSIPSREPQSDQEYVEEDNDYDDADRSSKPPVEPDNRQKTQTREELPQQRQRKTDVGKTIQWGRDADKD